MLAVRYLTLTALVIWVGGLVTVRWLLAPASEPAGALSLAGYICGGVMLLGLLVLKFVGPPPRAFFLRTALVLLMLAAAAASTFMPQIDDLAATFEIVVGFALLFWYVKE